MIWMYIHIHISIYIFTYISMYREREEGVPRGAVSPSVVDALTAQLDALQVL